MPSVSTFAYADGWAECIATEPLPCTVPGATAAAIRYDETESRLYVSVRGEDHLFAFDARGGRLTPIVDAPCGGKGPRDFALFGRYIVCTNENSDSVTVLDKYTFQILDAMELVGPLCVLKV